MPPQRLFITGTDTGVGKTHVTAWLARTLKSQGHTVGLYKPVCTGAIEHEGRTVWEDVERLSSALDGAVPRERICPQTFQTPVAPPQAATLESTRVNGELLFTGLDWWNDRCDVLLIEGVGGWLSPVTEDLVVADMAERMAARVLIVAANRLGVISHTLLTLESILARSLPIAGVIFNQVSPPAADGLMAWNMQEIASRGRGAVVFGELSYGAPPRLMGPRGECCLTWPDLMGSVT